MTMSAAIPVNSTAYPITANLSTSPSTYRYLNNDESTVSVVVFALTVVSISVGFIAAIVILVVYFRKKLKHSTNVLVQYTRATVHEDHSDAIRTDDGTLYIAMNSQPDDGRTEQNGSESRKSSGNIAESKDYRESKSFKNRIRFFWKKGTVKDDTIQPTYANIDVRKNVDNRLGVKTKTLSSKDAKGSGNAPGIYYSVNALRNETDVCYAGESETQALYENNEITKEKMRKVTIA